jgi:hypothetical protein
MKRILYGAQGRTDVRENRPAGTDAANWTPDNLSAGEIAGSVVADDVTFEGRGWEDVRVGAFFGAGFGGAETVTVQTLRAIRDPAGTNGRLWVADGTPLVLSPHGFLSAAITADKDLAFRITALTLNGAADVTIFVTGGKRVRPRS